MGRPIPFEPDEILVNGELISLGDFSADNGDHMLYALHRLGATFRPHGLPYVLRVRILVAGNDEPLPWAVIALTATATNARKLAPEHTRWTSEK